MVLPSALDVIHSFPPSERGSCIAAALQLIEFSLSLVEAGHVPRAGFEPTQPQP